MKAHMEKVDRRINIEAARKILSGQGFNASNEEVVIILDYLYFLLDLALEQVKSKD